MIALWYTFTIVQYKKDGDSVSVVEKYIDHVRKEAIENPEKTWNKMVLGFKANKWKTKILPKREIAKGYQKLEAMMMTFVADALSNEKRYVWSNIFAPCEIMDIFEVNTLSIECLSCYFAGYHLEDHFIDFAQNIGLAPTLCSYHKTFVGAVDSGVIPSPMYAVTTSLSCDGNLNTFRYLEKKKGVPFTFLDIPYQDDEDSVAYLAEQLKEFVNELEQRFHKSFDLEQLEETIRIENETRKELFRFFELQKKHYYPGELISQLYLMMGTHLLMGRKEFLELIQFMNEDIQTYPIFEGKRILWVHLLPFYQESLRSYFNSSEKYQIIASDIIIDYMDELDETKPFESLAKKIIQNVYNGSYQRKADMLESLVDQLQPYAMIHFCHWGCKQASGGSVLLKDRMKAKGLPMLILDGDGIDKRNSHDGQIKTRLEAFLELIETGEKTC